MNPALWEVTQNYSVKIDRCLKVILMVFAMVLRKETFLLQSINIRSWDYYYEILLLSHLFNLFLSTCCFEMFKGNLPTNFFF